MTSDRFLCLHCHFYQPPRENPWLESIEFQESARPYHDWNARISAECYRPNGLSRILDPEGWVVGLANNYAKISFNFGPTLLSWMREHDQLAYQAVLEGDRLSRELFDGHGSAIAQAYNHMILPLANRRDKETQVIWGLRDFEQHFNRPAEAMWLPETAVDTETLEILSYHGMQYVILAPRQAKAVRPIDTKGAFQEILEHQIDPKHPYLVRLPSGRSITAFFYDGPISQAVAFEKLLHNGETFANRLMQGFAMNDRRAQLLHIATDGETYGHHHRNGEMALSYAMDYIERKNLATLTNYAHFLSQHPPRAEVHIHEKSSWSCVHGVERWRNDCGCNSGGRPYWNQKWRAPLREALDEIRDVINPVYVEWMKPYTADPWGARTAYINVLLNRNPDGRAAFYARWLIDPDRFKTDPDSEVNFLKALEIQRHLMLMYTSCGWFFDELSGIETVQNLQYAWHALELAADVFGKDLRNEFKETLSLAPSNVPELDNGRAILEQSVIPARVDMERIGAHYGVSSLFAGQNRIERMHAFQFESVDLQRHFSGKAQLLCTHVKVVSSITRETKAIMLTVVHLGDHNINVGVRPYETAESYTRMKEDFVHTFTRGNLAESVRLLDKYFPKRLYSLKDMFKDEQKLAIDHVLDNTLESLEEQFVRLHEQYYPVMCYISDLGMGLPSVFLNMSEYVLNRRIKGALALPDIPLTLLTRYLEEAVDWKTNLDQRGLERSYREAVKKAFASVRAAPEDPTELTRFLQLLRTRDRFPFWIDIGHVQNDFFLWIRDIQKARFAREESWRKIVRQVAETLKVRLPF